MTEQLDRIEHLLKDLDEKLDLRIRKLEITSATLELKAATNLKEINGLRKTNTIWSAVNSSLIAIATFFAYVLKL